MIVGTIICHVLSHYKNKHYIRLLHRLIKKQGTNGLQASMTPFIPCFSITPSKEQMGHIALILAMLVAFASRTRGGAGKITQDWKSIEAPLASSPPSRARIAKRTSVWMSFLLCERETGIEPAAPTLARWCSTAEPLAHDV